MATISGHSFNIGRHFEPRSGSLNTILEVDHLRTIDDMFAILAYWFQRRRFKKKFPGFE
jgi:hypothetical protein